MDSIVERVKTQLIHNRFIWITVFLEKQVMFMQRSVISVYMNIGYGFEGCKDKDRMGLHGTAGRK